jgi:hypothetical protein
VACGGLVFVIMSNGLFLGARDAGWMKFSVSDFCVTDTAVFGINDSIFHKLDCQMARSTSSRGLERLQRLI